MELTSYFDLDENIVMRWLGANHLYTLLKLSVIFWECKFLNVFMGTWDLSVVNEIKQQDEELEKGKHMLLNLLICSAKAK